jgi:predicted dinucleotide-binding enzyme
MGFAIAILIVSLVNPGTRARAADSADAIAIIGTGHVGGGLGARLGAAHHVIIYGSRHPDDPEVRALLARSGAGASALLPAAAAAKAGVIILAVPWPAAEDAIKSMGELSGKVIIDTTNPIARDEHNRPAEFTLPMSGAELIQSWAPGAHVVKAFNTTNWLVLSDPVIAGGPVSIPMAGDDAAAKSRVSALVSEVGFDPVDAGPLRNAKLIEGMALLYIRMKNMDGRDAHEFYLRARPLRAGAPGSKPE